MARLKTDVPEHGKAEVLYMAMKEPKDLRMELILFGQRHKGHINPENARTAAFF